MRGYQVALIRRTYRRGRKHRFWRGLNEWYEFRIDCGPIQVGRSDLISARLGPDLDVRELSNALTRAGLLYRLYERSWWIAYPGGAIVMEDQPIVLKDEPGDG